MKKQLAVLWLALFLGVALPSYFFFPPVIQAQEDDDDDFELEDEDEDFEEDVAESDDDFSDESESDSDEESEEFDDDEEEFADDEDLDEVEEAVGIEEEDAEGDDELDLDDELDDEEEGGEEELADEEFDDELEEDGDEELESADGEENLEALSEEEAQQDDLFDDEFQQSLEEETPIEGVPAPIEETAQEESTGEEFSAEEETGVADSGAAAMEDTGPDLDYESRLHNIYLNFHKAPTAEEEWQTLIGGREAEIYEIRKGDTLWGISQLFFGDGNYWPKIWSLNTKIGNPHLISEGHSIGFVLGNESEAPSFTVTEGDGSNLNVTDIQGEDSESDGTEDETEETKIAEKESGPEIPPPGIVSAPVVKVLPPSLPILRSIDKKSSYGKTGMAVMTREVPVFTPKVTLSAFIDSKNIDRLGRIVEVETGYKVASLFQYVYVKVAAGVARVGDSLLIIRDSGKLIIPDEIKAEGDEHQYQILGVLKLIDFTKLDRSDEDAKKPVEHFRALITDMIEPVVTGSILKVGKIQKFPVSLEGPRSRAVAQIIGGSKARNMRLFTEGSLAYLNRGSDDGFAKGQVLAIRENRKIRRAYSKVRENLRPIGWLKVLDVSDKYSTAVIVEAWDGITIGDLTGLGELLPRAEVLQAGQKATAAKSDEDEYEYVDEGEEGDDSEYEYVDEGEEEDDGEYEYVDEDEGEGGYEDEGGEELAEDEEADSLMEEVAEDQEEDDEEFEEGEFEEASTDEDDDEDFEDDEEEDSETL